MRIEPAKVDAFTIFGAPALDPVTVVMQDFGGGSGRFIVECYGEAWSAWWGAMGNDDLRGFVTTCSADYVANRLWNSNVPGKQTRRRAYLSRPRPLTRSQRTYQEYLEVGDLYENFGHFLRARAAQRRGV